MASTFFESHPWNIGSLLLYWRCPNHITIIFWFILLFENSKNHEDFLSSCSELLEYFQSKYLDKLFKINIFFIKKISKFAGLGRYELYVLYYKMISWTPGHLVNESNLRNSNAQVRLFLKVKNIIKVAPLNLVFLQNWETPFQSNL